MAVIALLSMTSCKGNTPAVDSVTSAPVSEKGSEAPAKILPDFTATIAGHKYDGTPIVTTYSGEKVTGSYQCTSDGAVTEKWYKGTEELREAPKDIGDYAYYLAVDETATYKSASAKFPFTISALPLNFKGDFTKTYDGSEQMTISLTDTNSNIIKGDDVTMNITFASALPGSAIVNKTLTGDDKDNYALPDTVNASIVAANVATKPWSDLEDDTTWFTYDGQPHSLEVEDSDYYTVTGNEATEPGDHLVTATLKPGYAWSDGTTDPVTHHLAIRKEYEATMRAVVESYQTQFTEDQTDCRISILGTESGKVFKGMQVTLIDDYGIDLGKATVAEMAKVTEEAEEAVTEVGTGKTNKTMILLDGINPSVIAKNTTKTYLISLKTYTWEPHIIKDPTIYSEGAAAFIPNEEPNVQIPVVLPKLSAGDYDIITKTAATCTSTGVDVYSLKHDPADSAVYNTGSSLYKDEYVTALQNLCEFEVVVPIDATNHTGKSRYEWSKDADKGMPKYDILSIVASTGKADKYCDACKAIIASEDVEYTQGFWRKDSDKTYGRYYKFDRGTTHETMLKGDTGKDKWNVHVDANGGTTRKGAVTDATPAVTAQNIHFQIYVSKFEKTGYTFDSITYYVDGLPQGTITKSLTEANNRVYYEAGATDPYFVIRIGIHKDPDLGLNNSYFGDVYVQINWKKDA